MVVIAHIWGHPGQVWPELKTPDPGNTGEIQFVCLQADQEGNKGVGDSREDDGKFGECVSQRKAREKARQEGAGCLLEVRLWVVGMACFAGLLAVW